MAAKQRSRKPKPPSPITFVDVPPEYDRAIEIAWQRTRELIPEVPYWMREILKVRIVGIYMQGLMDGYECGLRDR
jgi:hypothetical protein